MNDWPSPHPGQARKSGTPTTRQLISGCSTLLVVIAAVWITVVALVALTRWVL